MKMPHFAEEETQKCADLPSVARDQLGLLEIRRTDPKCLCSCEGSRRGGCCWPAEEERQRRAAASGCQWEPGPAAIPDGQEFWWHQCPTPGKKELGRGRGEAPDPPALIWQNTELLKPLQGFSSVFGEEI